MRAEGGSPNLINGVSRQAPELRLPSQLQESLNQYPSVTKGLGPRNPAILMSRTSTALASTSIAHIINRDATERYVMNMATTGIEVKTFAGVDKTVNAPGGYAYLTGGTNADLEALTVADHTFILNKSKVITAGATTSPEKVNEALVHVASGEYHTNYSIIINGSVVASFLTGGGPFASPEEARAAERGVQASYIASYLIGVVPHPPADNAWWGTQSSYLNSTLGVVDWTFTKYDNVIHIKRVDGADFSIAVSAEGSETAFRCHKDTITDFVSLPKRAPNGTVLKVSGTKDNNFDDYYVKFEAPGSVGEGRWVEAVAPGITVGLNPATMPHLLVREADGTFTFKPGTWDVRDSGDLETNPWPSFVGSKAAGLIFFKNRFGMFSGESVSLTRDGGFFNFFSESALTGLDTDPIDVTISHDEVSIINHAVPTVDELILFTSSIPFRMTGGDVLTYSSTSFSPLLANRSSPSAKPINVGDKIVFANDVESGSFIHEFLYDQQNGIKEAPVITDHCQGYVPGGLTKIVGDDDLKLLALYAPAEPDTLYTYKWLFIGNDKAQSAWQKWTIAGAQIKTVAIIGQDLIVVAVTGGAIETYRIPCHEAWKDPIETVLMDRRVSVVATYNVGTDQSTWTLPYPAEGATVAITDAETFGFRPTVVASGSTLVASGNYSGLAAMAGMEFVSECELSPFVYRSKRGDGSDGVAVPGVNLKLASCQIATGPSSYIHVEVLRDYRQPFTYHLEASAMGTPNALLGSLVQGRMDKRFSIMADATNTRVKLRNGGPYPYSILTYRWSGGVYPKGY